MMLSFLLLSIDHLTEKKSSGNKLFRIFGRVVQSRHEETIVYKSKWNRKRRRAGRNTVRLFCKWKAKRSEVPGNLSLREISPISMQIVMQMSSQLLASSASSSLPFYFLVLRCNMVLMGYHKSHVLVGSNEMRSLVCHIPLCCCALYHRV